MFKAEIVYYSSTLDVGSGNEGFFCVCLQISRLVALIIMLKNIPSLQ